MLIRTARTGEEALLAGLIRKAYADVAVRFDLTPLNCPKHPSNCTPQWVRKDLSRGVTYYILEISGRPVGCAAFEQAGPDSGYLERLSVLPDFRRQGFGRKLVEHVLSVAQARGVAEVGIGIIARQEELKQWYAAIGFVEGQTKTFAHLPFEVAFMTCTL